MHGQHDGDTGDGLVGPPLVVSAASARVAAVATALLRWPSRVVPPNRAGVIALRGLFGAALPLLVRTRPTGATATRVRVRVPAATVVASGATATPVRVHGGVPAATAAAATVRGEWVRPAPARRRHEAAVLLYLHGGAYVTSSPRAHRGIVARIANATGADVFAVSYRRAPEHRFPAAADDARGAWGWLRAQGLAPERIVLAGDSAGGQLALGLALQVWPGQIHVFQAQTGVLPEARAALADGGAFVAARLA